MVIAEFNVKSGKLLIDEHLHKEKNVREERLLQVPIENNYFSTIRTNFTTGLTSQ